MSGDNFNDIAVSYWQQGKGENARGNNAKAIELFKQALQLSPDSFRIRKSLRKTQWALIPRDATVPKLQNLKLLKLKAQLKLDQTREDWEGVLKRCEEALEIVPHDPELNFTAGEACLELGYQQTARFEFESALELDPRNRTFLRRCATMAEDEGKFTTALKLWQRIQESSPHDAAVDKKIAKLMASSYLEEEKRKADHRKAKKETAARSEADTMLDEGDTDFGAVRRGRVATDPEPTRSPTAESPPRAIDRATSTRKPPLDTSHAAGADSPGKEPPRIPRSNHNDAGPSHRIDAAEAGTPPVARLPEHIVKILIAADSLLQARQREAAEKLLHVAVDVSGGDPRVQKRLDAFNGTR